MTPSIHSVVSTRRAERDGAWRGTVLVPGAGHASTLGNRVDLLAEIRKAFPAEAGTDPAADARERGAAWCMPPCDQSEGWARGLLDRTYDPVPPADYVRYARGGDLYPGA